MSELEELAISELEIWLADGPDIDEIVERFCSLEDKLDNAYDENAALKRTLEGERKVARHHASVINTARRLCNEGDEQIATLKRFCLMVQESIEGGRKVTFQDIDIEELDALLTEDHDEQT